MQNDTFLGSHSACKLTPVMLACSNHWWESWGRAPFRVFWATRSIRAMPSRRSSWRLPCATTTAGLCSACWMNWEWPGTYTHHNAWHASVLLCHAISLTIESASLLGCVPAKPVCWTHHSSSHTKRPMYPFTERLHSAFAQYRRANIARFSCASFQSQLYIFTHHELRVWTMTIIRSCQTKQTPVFAICVAYTVHVCHIRH